MSRLMYHISCQLTNEPRLHCTSLGLYYANQSHWAVINSWTTSLQVHKQIYKQHSAFFRSQETMNNHLPQKGGEVFIEFWTPPFFTQSILINGSFMYEYKQALGCHDNLLSSGGFVFAQQGKGSALQAKRIELVEAKASNHFLSDKWRVIWSWWNALRLSSAHLSRCSWQEIQADRPHLEYHRIILWLMAKQLRELAKLWDRDIVSGCQTRTIHK